MNDNQTAAEFLAEQGRLADAATEGPWEFHQDDGSPLDISEVCIPRPDEEMPLSIASLLEDHDGAFIAASRTSVPRMVKALEAVLALHRQHRDVHPKDPSVINGNWYCCGAVQLGAVSPYECVECVTEEWPCPTVKAITAALEGPSA